MHVKNKLFIVCVLLGLLLTSCDDFEKQSLKTLNISRDIYNAVSVALVTAQGEGKISPSDWNNNVQPLLASMHDAIESGYFCLRVYRMTKTEDNKQAVIMALAVLPDILAELNRLKERYQ